MRRMTDWRAKLSALIEARRRQPADAASNNCGLFVADAILAMTGEDLAAEFRQPFVSYAEAIAAVHAAGFNNVCALAASRLEEIPTVAARAGDVMAFPLDGAWSLGIVNGERVTVLRPDGLGTVERSKALRAFRVP